MKNLNSKNICLIMPTYFHANPRSIRIARALVQEGYHLDIICFNDSSFARENQTQLQGVNVHTLAIERRKTGKARYLVEYLIFSILAFIKMSQLFHYRRFSLVHVNNPPDSLVFITVCHKWIYGCRVLLDISEPLSKSYAKKFSESRGFFLQFLDWIQLAACRYADRVITVSRAFQQELVRIGVAKTQISILANSPDKTFFDPDVIKNRKRDFGYEQKFVILYQGAVTPERGIDILVDTVDNLKADIPHILGIIVGAGSLLPYLQDLVIKKGLENYITITGFLPPREVPAYVAMADICLLMAKKIPVYELYSPDKLFEYMTFRKMIIAPRLQGIIDITGDDGVLLYEPGDAADLTDKILYCYHNPDLVKEYIGKAELIFQPYRWENTRRELYHCYDLLLNNKR
ncbi:MAG: glycosyltransferase family 4 protein [Candidatus Cloacimonetes bacterium]|nr:glycosyltransferase family 4 protein [Candidatus Cloacimonadota bacterium]